MKYTTDGTLLTMHNVCLSFDGVPVLRNVCGAIQDIVGHGQVVGLLGPSGMGKTQLSLILAGLQPATSGQVLVGKAQTPVQRGEVGVVPQEYPVFFHRTVLDNLTTAAAQRYDETAAQGRDRALSMLTRFGMEHLTGAWPQQLSGGQRQRLSIGQQLMCSEHLLIMDEPLSGLDPINVDLVCQMINEVAESHELNTIIILTHDVRSAIKVSDHLWMLGRERDSNGEPVPGAFVKYEYDLAEMGMAWRPDLSRTTEFTELDREIRDKFKML